MFRMAVNELSTIGWSFEEDVLHYREAGFSSIGIYYPKLVEYGQEKAIELLQETGFSISSLTHACDFTVGNNRSYRHSLIQALDVVQTASDIGSPTVSLMIGGRNGHTKNHALRILAMALSDLAEASQAVNVQLAIEPSHKGCGSESCLNTIPQCLDLIDRVDNPNLGISFDSYHLAQESIGLKWLDCCAHIVRLVQLGDAKHAPMGSPNRCPLGQGRLPLLHLISQFHQHGYDGYFEIDVQGAGASKFDYAGILHQSRCAAQLWQQHAATVGS